MCVKKSNSIGEYVLRKTIDYLILYLLTLITLMYVGERLTIKIKLFE